jgi:hypothetical protein
MRTIKSYYDRCRREGGYDAAAALRAAKIWRRFDELESAGLVRMRAEDEQENWFDVFGEPEAFTDIHGRRVTAEQAREQIADSIARNGNYWIVAEYRDSDGQWEQADSIGMCSGYENPLSPLENWYVPDLMDSALDAVAEVAEAREQELASY